MKRLPRITVAYDLRLRNLQRLVPYAARVYAAVRPAFCVPANARTGVRWLAGDVS